MSINDFEVLAENLHNVCDTDSLGFETTDEVAKLEGTFCQERALSALKLAVDIDADGYFCFRQSGFRKKHGSSLIYSTGDLSQPLPTRQGYIYNYEDPSQPLAISMSCGMIRQLGQDMDDLTSSGRQKIS